MENKELMKTTYRNGNLVIYFKSQSDTEQVIQHNEAS